MTAAQPAQTAPKSPLSFRIFKSVVVGFGSGAAVFFVLFATLSHTNPDARIIFAMLGVVAAFCTGVFIMVPSTGWETPVDDASGPDDGGFTTS